MTDSAWKSFKMSFNVEITLILGLHSTAPSLSLFDRYPSLVSLDAIHEHCSSRSKAKTDVVLLRTAFSIGIPGPGSIKARKSCRPMEIKSTRRQQGNAESSS